MDWQFRAVRNTDREGEYPIIGFIRARIRGAPMLLVDKNGDKDLQILQWLYEKITFTWRFYLQR